MRVIGDWWTSPSQNLHTVTKTQKQTKQSWTEQKNFYVKLMCDQKVIIILTNSPSLSMCVCVCAGNEFLSFFSYLSFFILHTSPHTSNKRMKIESASNWGVKGNRSSALTKGNRNWMSKHSKKKLNNEKKTITKWCEQGEQKKIRLTHQHDGCFFQSFKFF